MTRHPVAMVSFVLACTLVACEKRPLPPPPAPTQEKTMQMGSESLYTNGSQWVFRYTSGGKVCFVVGDGVSFGTREVEHLAVKLDANISIDVPTDGKYRVLYVYQGGYTDVSIDPDDSSSPKDLLQTVLAKKELWQHDSSR